MCPCVNGFDFFTLTSRNHFVYRRRRPQDSSLSTLIRTGDVGRGGGTGVVVVRLPSVSPPGRPGVGYGTDLTTCGGGPVSSSSRLDPSPSTPAGPGEAPRVRRSGCVVEVQGLHRLKVLGISCPFRSTGLKGIGVPHGKEVG